MKLIMPGMITCNPIVISPSQVHDASEKTKSKPWLANGVLANNSAQAYMTVGISHLFHLPKTLSNTTLIKPTRRIQLTMPTNPSKSKSTGKSSEKTGKPPGHNAHAGGKKAPKVLIKVDLEVKKVLTEKQ